MADSIDIYDGADYGLNPSYTDYGVPKDFESESLTGYSLSASTLGFPSDPTTANQLQAVSKKLSSGAKVVEVSGVNIALPGGELGVMDAIPAQHWKEIERLKKLTGAELTFHGPLVEPTGITRQGWEDTQRQIAERNMFSAIEKGHALNPEGNTPIVFHSSNIGIEPEVTVKDEKTGEEVITAISAIDERTGQIQQNIIAPPEKDYLAGGKQPNPYDNLDERNTELWAKQLQGLSFHAHQGAETFNRLLDKKVGLALKEEDKENILKLYKQYVKEPTKAIKFLDKWGGDKEKAIYSEAMQNMTHGDLYIRDAYQDLKKLYNQAYYVAEKEDNTRDLELLQKYRKEVGPKLKAFEEDPSKAVEFSQAIINGVNTLRQLDNAPKTLTPLKDFMMDKSSDTFANVAFKAYSKYGHNQKQDTTPIIAIENPPSDRFPLSRGTELKELIEKSQDKFKTLAMKELGMKPKEAEKQAKKIIGATWDTAHINLLRGKGYNEKDILKEVEAIKPYVKHVHISDNFGLGDTELPPGMGNAQIKETLKLIEGYNDQAKKLSKIVETGSWYSALKMQGTPFLESLRAFQSPVYAMKAAPYWNQAADMLGTGSYFAGYGLNPDIHHTIYGAGFSGLPAELGGQLPGRDASRLSGNPLS